MQSKNKITNVFTIDTEDWFHANYEDGLFENKLLKTSTVEKNTEMILESLKRTHSTATFFVLGFIAENHPNLLKSIAKAGHEIASHGYGHQLVYKQSKEDFREDVRKSKILIEDIVGKPVLGYRAPSWSITENSLWALDILTEEGFKYDSSIFPFKNFLYGIPGAPRFPYISKIYAPDSNLLEIPPSTIHIPGMNIPFSGGFYFRVCPYWVIQSFTQMINRSNQKVVFYLHPREIDPYQPHLKLKLRDRLIHYYGINSCAGKLNKLLSKFPSSSICNAFELNKITSLKSSL